MAATSAAAKAPPAPKPVIAGAIRVGLTLGRAIILLAVASTLGFVLLQFSGGDAVAAKLGDAAGDRQQYLEVREQLGLDRPALAQYLSWVRHAVRGDLGTSYVNEQPVSSLLASRIPVTLSLTLFATILTALLAISLGVLAALFEGRWPDRLITAWTSTVIAAPSFFLGLILVLVFALRNHYLPATGYTPLADSPTEYLRHLILPAITLAIPYSATVARQLRASMLEVLTRDYVRTAEAKGMPARTVIIKHALRNAALPAITLFGLEVIAMLGGAVIVEAVFNLPGLGSLAVQSVLSRDTPVILGILIFGCIMALAVTIIVDSSYAGLNPRLRRRS